MMLKTIGNVLWVIFGGIFSALMWLLAGVLCCITVVGIPFGVQCFKFARLGFLPFGKEVVFGGGAVKTVVNIFWLLLLGIPMAVADALMGLLLCVTIVGIPFGLQHFKLAKLALMPFGAKVMKKR